MALPIGLWTVFTTKVRSRFSHVSVDDSAVAYYKVVDAVKSVVAIENVRAAINQIAQTTLRKVVGQHTLDQTLSETDQINLDIRKILEVTRVEWDVEVTLVELNPAARQHAARHGPPGRGRAGKARQDHQRRGESPAAAALGQASDTMMAHPLVEGPLEQAGQVRGNRRCRGASEDG